MSDSKFTGKCRECQLDLSNVAELDCKHPKCPAWSENTAYEVIGLDEFGEIVDKTSIRIYGTEASSGD